MTKITTFKTYEWLRAFIEVGLALLLGSVVTAWYFATQVVPAAIAEQNVQARKQEIRTLYSARNGCNWVEVDERLICKAKKGIK